MGLCLDPEIAWPHFGAIKQAFDRLAGSRVPGTEMCYLSMGVSNTCQVAIEEGANMVCLGTTLFGERPT